jgi:hypothetical protein
MYRVAPAFALVGTLIIGACTVAPPEGPSIAAMPPPGKNLEAFQQDDGACRQYAAAQTGISPGQAAQQSAVNSAVVGTVLGAAAGAAIGAAAGNPGAGAAIGAGTGALFGTASGANAAAISGANVQRRYDVSYAQCMAARGDNVPPIASNYYPAPPYPPPAYAYPAYYYPYPPYPAYVGVGFGYRWRR